MSTSANVTEVSANSQWNDIFTLVGTQKIYNGFVGRFRESAKDKPVKRAYREYHGKAVTRLRLPVEGQATPAVTG